ncbi:MAG: hypothetical protein AB9869_03665 [Verrucomicrobiia bacterium]
MIALAVDRLDEDDGEEAFEEGEPFILSNIEELPKKLLDEIRLRHLAFEKRASKMAGSSYFMNLCRCGAHFGDFFLHSEPGGAFFPDSEVDTSRIVIEKLPLTGRFDVVSSWGMGTGGLIFEHGNRVDGPLIQSSSVTECRGK